MLRTLIFYTILIGAGGGNLLWWFLADRAARSFGRPRLWRMLIGCWCGMMVLLYILLVFSRVLPQFSIDSLPRVLMCAMYIWLLPFVLPWLAWRTARWGAGRARRRMKTTARSSDPNPNAPTRRQFLQAAAIAAPPVAVGLLSMRTVQKLEEFRTQSITLHIPSLPLPLAGMTIAHVTDIHIGQFTSDRLLNTIVERTNAMKADVVLFGGDLIDFNLADLPAGIAWLKRFDSRYGVVLCEGNHDIMQDRFAFERKVEQAGLPMPINGSTVLSIRGQPVQFLSLRWGGADVTDTSADCTEAMIADSTQATLSQLRAGLFPIVQTHHPHTFDYLGNANVPLVLAGHTHGGQIRIGPICPASIRFRYLSGLYQKPGKQLFVNNGCGNWFPLRIGAPAEIVKLTLQPA